MSRRQFCAMKITEQVRAYAREHGLTEEQALATGMQEKAQEFKRKKLQIYQDT